MYAASSVDAMGSTATTLYGRVLGPIPQRINTPLLDRKPFVM